MRKATNAENSALNATCSIPGLDANLSMTSSNNTYYYFNDALGSVRNLVDANEVVQNTYDYRAFGENLSATENVTSPYRFTARDYEPGGLSQAHYYRNRYYMPWTGIFMSRDAMWADLHQGWGYVGVKSRMFCKFISGELRLLGAKARSPERLTASCRLSLPGGLAV